MARRTSRPLAALLAAVAFLALARRGTADTQTPLGTAVGEGSTPFTGLAAAPEANLFTGAMGTAIPIEVPPGRRSMTPKLALTYSSAGGPGPYGIGWDLPIGKIERTTKYGAPHPSSSHFDTDFVVTLPGLVVELMPSSGCPAQPAGTCFRPRVEEGHFSATRGTNDVWTARDRTGLTWTFGATPASRFGPAGFTSVWYLTGVQDPNGNRIDVVYTTFDGVPYPEWIGWGGNALFPWGPGQSFPNFYWVKLDWQARPAKDRPIDVRHGAPMLITHRLHRIRVIQTGVCQVNGTPPHVPTCPAHAGFRAYVFEYKGDTGLLRSVKVGVPQPDGTVKKTFPVQTFQYQKAGGFTHQSWPPPQSPGPLQKLRLIDDRLRVRQSLLDIDGDGRVDHVESEPGFGGFWRVRLGCSPGANRPAGCTHPFGFSSQQVTWDARVDGGTFVPGFMRYTYDDCPGRPGTCSQWDTFDISGDGIADLVRPQAGGVWKVYAGEVNGGTRRFRPTPIFWSAPAGVDPFVRWDAGDYLKQDVRDMNGDGLPDLVVGDRMPWNVYVNTGGGFETIPRAWEAPFPDLEVTASDDANAHALLDFNGDGLLDIVQRSVFAGWDARCGGTGPGGKSCLFVYWNNGRGFEPTPAHVVAPWQGWQPVNGKGTKRDLVDVNGDGLPDLVDTQSPANDGVTRVALNRGSDLEEPILANGVWAAPTTWPTLPAGQVLRDVSRTQFVDMIDVDGDGRIDRVQSANSGNWNVYLNSNPFQTRPRTNLLKSMLNGLGGKTTILYRPSTDFPHGNRLPFVTWVTTAIRQTDGLCQASGNVYDRHSNPCIDAGHEQIAFFRYANGLFDAPTREFRGFRTVTRIDIDGNETVRTFAQDRERKGKVEVTEIRAGALVVRREKTLYNVSTFGNGRKLVWLGLAETVTFDDLGEFSGQEHEVVRNNVSVDEHGNVLQSERTGSSPKYTTTTEYANLGGIHAYDRPSHTVKKDGSGNTLEEQWFYYDTRGNLARTEALDTNPSIARRVATRFEYDAFGNVTRVIDAHGNATTTTHDGIVALFPEVETNALGHTTLRTFDYALGREKPLTVTDPNNGTTRYEYDDAGRLTSKTLPLADRLVSETYAYHYGSLSGFSGVDVFTREPGNATGYVKTTQYFDALGRSRGLTTRRQVGSGAPDIYAYDFVTYDAAGRVARRYDPSHIDVPLEQRSFTAYEYRLNGGPIDPLGRVHRTTQPNGRSTEVRYKGHVVEQYDELGIKTVLRLNAEGQPFSRETYDQHGIFNSAVHYSYDPLGRLVMIQQNQSVASRIEITVDTLGRRKTVKDPDSGTTTYEYDAVGNLVFENDPKTGQSIQYCWDALRRLTRKLYLATDWPSKSCATSPYDPANEERYTYDQGFGQIGRLTRVDDPSGSTTFTYDLRGRVVSTTKTIAGKSATTSFQYDVADHVTRTTYPDGTTVATTYNQVGQPTRHGNVVTAVEYDLFGRVTWLAHGNGTGDVRVYDGPANNHRLRRLVTGGPGGNLLDLQFDAYTARGQIARVRDLRDASGALSNTADYTYDFARRLVAASGPGIGQLSWAYDTFGNFTQKEGRSVTYGSRPHQPTSVGGVTVTHDANGNRASKGNTTYTYDRANRLTKIVAGNKTVTFAYDYTGTRVMKAAGGKTTRYYGPLFEVTGSTQTRHYIVGGTRVASEDSTVPGGATYASATPGGGLVEVVDLGGRPALEVALGRGAALAFLAMTALLLVTTVVWTGRRRRLGLVAVRRGPALALTVAVAVGSLPWAVILVPATAEAACDPPPSGARHYHLDHLGSTQVITNANGAIATQIRYSPFGAPRHRAGSLSDRGRYEFTGYETESVSGLEYAGSRFYDPDLGLFQTHDPARQFKSPYSYGGGDPVNGTDPTGRDFGIGLIIAAFVIGAVASAINAAVQGASFEQVLKAAAIGGAIGGATAGVAELVTPVLGQFAAHVATQVVGPGVVSAEAVTELALTGSWLYALGSGIADAVDGDYTGVIAIGLTAGWAVVGAPTSGAAPDDGSAVCDGACGRPSEAFIDDFTGEAAEEAASSGIQQSGVPAPFAQMAGEGAVGALTGGMTGGPIGAVRGGILGVLSGSFSGAVEVLSPSWPAWVVAKGADYAITGALAFALGGPASAVSAVGAAVTSDVLVATLGGPLAFTPPAVGSVPTPMPGPRPAPTPTPGRL